MATVEPMNEDYQARLAHARRIQLIIVATTVVVGCGVGLIVGLIEHSVGWGIVAFLAAGIVFCLVGSLMFLTLGGREWLRMKGGPGAS